MNAVRVATVKVQVVVTCVTLVKLERPVDPAVVTENVQRAVTRPAEDLDQRIVKPKRKTEVDLTADLTSQSERRRKKLEKFLKNVVNLTIF